jgi:hypothetical protein
VVLPVDLPARLGIGLLDRTTRYTAHHTVHGRDDGQHRPGAPAKGEAEPISEFVSSLSSSSWAGSKR